MSCAAPSAKWIISRRDDLLWFQGSVVAGIALLLFFWIQPPLRTGSYSAWNPVVMALLLWGVLFDGTHVWGTYARSYRAPDEASRSALPGSWAWAIIAVGPIFAVIDAVVLHGNGWLFRDFLLLANLWAYWHLVRQHYGFLVLYRRKAGETNRWGGRLDALLLWAGTLYPYFRFSLSESYRNTGLPQLVPPQLLGPSRMALDIAFITMIGGIVVLIVSGRIEPFRLEPKHLFLAIVIAFSFAVFALLDNLLTIAATLTIFHNLQYHRIVWQYERGLGRTPSGSLAAYLGLGVILGVAWYVPRIVGVTLVHDNLSRNVLLGLGWGVAFHHYLVDGRIWRVRRTPTVAEALDAGAVKS